MKIRTIALSLLFMVGIAHAGVNGFRQEMQELINSGANARGSLGMESLAEKFEEVGERYGDHWEPYYCSAFFYARAAQLANEVGYRAKMWGMAEMQMTKTMSFDMDQSEAWALKAYIKIMKATAFNTDMDAGLLEKIQDAIKQSKRLDYENPRAYFVAALYEVLTKSRSGESMDQAKKELKVALQYFETEKKRQLIPYWGQEQAKALNEKLR